jgi:hypothetical protein
MQQRTPMLEEVVLKSYGSTNVSISVSLDYQK